MHELPQMAILLRVEKLRINNGLQLNKSSGLGSETRMLTNIMLEFNDGYENTTDLEVLNTIYELYHSDFVAFEEGDDSRDTKIHVPIDCKKIAGKLKVDSDIIFGRLYYHLNKQYGYKQPDGSTVSFFAMKVGRDSKCINFPLMTSVLAGLRQEKRKFRIGTTIAVFALMVSVISLTISTTQLISFNKSIHPTAEASND